MNELGDVINAAAIEAGLEPVIFDPPLKSLSALVRLRKELEPESLIERHAVIGWALTSLVDWFGKGMYDVRALHLTHDKERVTIEAVVCLHYLTQEADHEAWLNNIIANIPGQDWESKVYLWKPRRYAWDSAERLGNVIGFTQMRGDGVPTGTLDEEMNEQN